MVFQTLQIPDRTNESGAPSVPDRSRRAAGRLGAVAALALTLLAACGKSPGSRDPNEPPHPDAPKDLSYATGVILAEQDAPIDPVTPTVTGVVDAYSVAPALPAGLTLDAQTGRISGTVTLRVPTAAYTISAQNVYGIGKTILSVRVSGTPRFAYAANEGDNTISLFTANAAASSLRHHGYYAQSAPEASPTDVQVDPQGRFLYSVNNFALTPYVIDPATGRLTVGAPQSISTGPHSLYVHPTGSFLFLTTSTKDRLRVYAVDPGDGSLSKVEDYTTQEKPSRVIGDPNGRYLFVLHELSGKILSYTIDPATGLATERELVDLTAEAGQAIETPAAALGPRGESLYVVLQAGFKAILRYEVDPSNAGLSTGQLKDGLGTDLVDVVVDPAGRNLYLSKGSAGTVSRFPIEFETGKLGAVASMAGTTGTVSLRFSEDGSVAWGARAGPQMADVHSVDPITGDLTRSDSVRARKNPQSLAVVHGTSGVEVRATSLYVVNKGDDSVTAFTIDPATGAIDDQGAIAAPTGTGPADIAVDPLGRFLYAANSVSGDITVFAIGTDGSLTDNDTLYSFDDDGPVAVEADPSGRYLYLALPEAELVVQLSVQGDGTLDTPVEQAIADTPDSMAVDPTGRFLYVVDGDDDIIQVFSIDPLDGSLSPVGTAVDAVGYPTRLGFGSGGARAYATLRATNRVLALDVQSNGGLGTITGDIETAFEPNEILFTPDGRFAYVAALDSGAVGSVLLYDVDPDTGELFDSIGGGATWRWQFLAGNNPRDLEVSTDGAFLYVLSGGSEDVRVFSIDPVDGILTWAPPARQPGLVPLKMRMLYVVE